MRIRSGCAASESGGLARCTRQPLYTQVFIFPNMRAMRTVCALHKGQWEEPTSAVPGDPRRRFLVRGVHLEELEFDGLVSMAQDALRRCYAPAWHDRNNIPCTYAKAEQEIRARACVWYGSSYGSDKGVVLDAAWGADVVGMHVWGDSTTVQRLGPYGDSLVRGWLEGVVEEYHRINKEG